MMISMDGVINIPHEMVAPMMRNERDHYCLFIIEIVGIVANSFLILLTYCRLTKYSQRTHRGGLLASGKMLIFSAIIKLEIITHQHVS